jgi:hypothetical protein
MLPVLTTLLLALAACGKQPAPVVVPSQPRCELRPPPTWPAVKFTRCGDAACTDADTLNNLWLYQRDVVRWESEVLACGGQPVSAPVVEAVRKPD